MRDKVTLSEKCIELANHVVDDPDEPAAPAGDGGFSEAFQIAANMLRIGAEETYRSLETLLKRTPAIRDAFAIDTDDMPDSSSVCKWYQDLLMEVWRLFLCHSAEVAGISGRAAIDSTFFERKQSSQYYLQRSERSVKTIKATTLTDTESLAVLDVHCCIEREHDTKAGPQVVRRNADDLRAVAADTGFQDWKSKFEFYALGVDPLILERGSKPQTVGHNALIQDAGYTQRWMAETSYSAVKHSLGSAVRARFWYRQFREIVLMFAVNNTKKITEKL